MDQIKRELRESLGPLGEFRQMFATTWFGFAVSVIRSLIPLALGCGLIAAAEYWLVTNWKHYLALVSGVLLTLQGLRLLVRTLLRRDQKLLVFEKGIAVWRYGRLATYPWSQLDQVEANVAKAEGAPTSFLGFSFVGRNQDGAVCKYNFHPAGDPIPNLKSLWQIIDQEVGRSRGADAIATLQAGQEVSFQRVIWGKVVSTQIGISLFGIRVKPRYDPERFLNWYWVDRIAVVETPEATREEGYSSGGISHLEVFKRFDSEPWVSELVSEIPGYQALLDAAEFARGRFEETVAELHREKLPEALDVIDAGKELCLGKFGISQYGFRFRSEIIPWQELGYLHFDRDKIVAPVLDNRTFAYDDLALAERWLLQMIAMSVRSEQTRAEDE